MSLDVFDIVDAEDEKQDVFDRVGFDDIFEKFKIDFFDWIKSEIVSQVESKSGDFVQEIKTSELTKQIDQKILAALDKKITGILSENKEQMASMLNKVAEAQRFMKKELPSSDDISALKKSMEAQAKKVTEELEALRESSKKKYDDLRNELLQAPTYQFGGFPLSGGGLPFANWRFRENGTQLIVETLVNGAWVESSAFLQPS